MNANQIRATIYNLGKESVKDPESNNYLFTYKVKDTDDAEGKFKNG